MKKTRLFLIGAGREQVPAIDKAHEMGLEVIATDINPAAEGAKLADIFEPINILDQEANLKLAQFYQVDAVLTLSELAVPTASYVAQNLRLPGLDKSTAYRATNKNLMREVFAQYQVPTTPSFAIDNTRQLFTAAQEFGYPVVIKPSDRAAQRGITFVRSESELLPAYQHAVEFSLEGKAIIEKFIDGTEINVTSIVCNGYVHFLSLSERCKHPSYFGIAIEHLSPPELPASQQQLVYAAAEKAIKAIGLHNGIAYPQIIVNEQGAWVIEIAARIPGGYMREMALLQSGIDMVEAAIYHALGTFQYERLNVYTVASAVSILHLTEVNFPDIVGRRLKEITGYQQALSIPGVREVKINLLLHEEIPVLESGAQRFGVIIATGNTREEASQRSKDALCELKLIVC